MTRVALVVLDTVRSDVFETNFTWLPGTRFENAWSPSHWTTPVHGSLFTGTYPSEHGIHAKGQTFDIDGMSLAERLSAAGYTTRAFSANPNISAAFDFDRGFDVFEGNTGIRSISDRVYDWSAFTSEQGGDGPTRYLYALREIVTSDCDTSASLKWGLLFKLHDAGLWTPTDSGATDALKWLRRQTHDDDEFVFLNLMEAHDPYDRIPESYRTNPSYDPPQNIGLQHVHDPPDSSEIWHAYEDAVRYLSDVYKRIYKQLERQMDYIITVSDHGELLGDHGLWGHTYSLHEELTHVPLVISGDGFDNESKDDVVSLIDVNATIADLTGVDRGDSRGTSLRDDIEPRPILVEGHGLTAYRRQSMIEKGYDADPYDVPLRGVVVPPSDYGHELTDEWVTVRGNREQLQLKRDELVDGLDERSVVADEELGERTLQHLRDLGYA